ncbi:MAG: hypothetical protein OEX83_06940, partial [Gammaproteobacteria bacterium]|nr:hypothetical protein [Gammaproteobacteria bacterium]
MRRKTPINILYPILLGLVLCLSGLTVQAETVLDNFNNAVFTGNNGTQNWSTDWIEINESDGAANGDVRIRSESGDNRLRIKDNGGGGEGVKREANLSGATAATLSFLYKRNGLDNAKDYVTIEVSGDGGVSWVELDRFKGGSNDSSYKSASYDITAYIATNTQIRLLSSPDMGNNDIVYFDDVQIAYTIPTTPHFSIAHDGIGSNCAVENITVNYHPAAHVAAAYAGTITLSTTTGVGDWSLVSGSGTLTNNSNGAATYLFSASDGGQVVLGLSHSTSATVNINITDGTHSEGGTEDADIIFSNSSTGTYADDF